MGGLTSHKGSHSGDLYSSNHIATRNILEVIQLTDLNLSIIIQLDLFAGTEQAFRVINKCANTEVHTAIEPNNISALNSTMQFVTAQDLEIVSLYAEYNTKYEKIQPETKKNATQSLG